MADSSFALARATGIWLTLIAVESIHGVMRRVYPSSRNSAISVRDR